MAKIYGLFGSMTGKLADTVMAVRNGEQIVRKYQPVVANPKTAAQLETRAKLKLMSQLSAALAPVIAFRRQGTVSPRNLFTRANFGLATAEGFENGILTTAVQVEALDLTGGIRALPTLATPAVSGSSVSVALSDGAAEDVSGVVYAVFGVKEGSRLFYLGSTVVEAATNTRTYPGSLELPAAASGSFVVYAYAMIQKTEAASLLYENYKAKVSSMEAVLKVVRNMSVNDVEVSETKSASFTVA